MELKLNEILNCIKIIIGLFTCGTQVLKLSFQNQLWNFELQNYPMALPWQFPEMTVVYLNQLSGAAGTQKLFETLFWVHFQPFCLFSKINRKLTKNVKKGLKST